MTVGLRAAGVPRFMVDGLHRTVALLAVVLRVIHILTSVLDNFAPISLVEPRLLLGRAHGSRV